MISGILEAELTASSTESFGIASTDGELKAPLIVPGSRLLMSPS